MPDPRKTGANCRIGTVNRRRLVGVATGALAAPVLAGAAVAQEELNATPELGTPVASPAVSIDIDVDALYALSQKLVGGGELDPKAAEPLAMLIGSDEDLAAGFDELVQLEDPTVQEGLPANASAARTNILLYWYDGYFGDQPVENRAAIFFGLPVWSTVPYSTQPTLCKAFGYWATEINIGDEATAEAGS